MIEPLYSIGQAVAVCTPNLSVVIPRTHVEVIRWLQAGEYISPITGAPVTRSRPGWEYLVVESPVSLRGNRVWFREHSLRRLDPADYLDPATTDTEEPMEKSA